MVQLSKRLQSVADLAESCETMADVGTDHGYIPVYLVACKKAKRAIAMDVNQGPLLRAEEHILQYGMEEHIKTRLSDGLSALKPKEAEVIVIAGMGGALMMRILSQGAETARSAKELILQPQSELMAFRKFLYENGYQIMAEDMVCEDGKYYPMMAVKFVTEAADVAAFSQNQENIHEYCLEFAVQSMRKKVDAAAFFSKQEEKQQVKQFRRIVCKYGPVLLKHRHPVLKQYLLQQQQQKQKILKSLQTNARKNVKDRIAEVKQELADIETALGLWNEM